MTLLVTIVMLVILIFKNNTISFCGHYREDAPNVLHFLFFHFLYILRAYVHDVLRIIATSLLQPDVHMPDCGKLVIMCPPPA